MKTLNTLILGMVLLQGCGGAIEDLSNSINNSNKPKAQPVCDATNVAQAANCDATTATPTTDSKQQAVSTTTESKVDVSTSASTTLAAGTSGDTSTPSTTVIDKTSVNVNVSVSTSTTVTENNTTVVAAPVVPAPAPVVPAPEDPTDSLSGIKWATNCDGSGIIYMKLYTDATKDQQMSTYAYPNLDCTGKPTVWVQHYPYIKIADDGFIEFAGGLMVSYSLENEALSLGDSHFTWETNVTPSFDNSNVVYHQVK